MSQFPIFRDYWLHRLGLNWSEKQAHAAHRWLLPAKHTGLPEDAKAGFFDKLFSKGRTDFRKWIFGMTSLQEQAYYEWYGKNLYQGHGKIVELGCWLGSLTRALGRGLAENPNFSQKKEDYHVYDLFEWLPPHDDAVKGSGFEGRFQEGDCFMKLFVNMNKPVTDTLTVHKADLSQEQWTGEPIELLLIDAMKSEVILRNIQQSFFPALIEGKGLLAHQDFIHFYEVWIHIAMFLLKDSFEPVYEVPGGASYVFRFLRQPDAKLLDFPDSVKECPEDLVKETYEWALGLMSDAQVDRMAAAHVMAYYHRGDEEMVRQLHRKYYSKGPYQSSHEFGMLNAYLKTLGFDPTA